MVNVSYWPIAFFSHSQYIWFFYLGNFKLEFPRIKFLSVFAGLSGTGKMFLKKKAPIPAARKEVFVNLLVKLIISHLHIFIKVIF